MALRGKDQLSNLPVELQIFICLYLTNYDIKNLRLANKSLCSVAKLRLYRVFLSANPRNVEVFRAIAGHEIFRKEIVEIIWDDALLSGSYADLDVQPDHEHQYVDRFEDEDSSDDAVPDWVLEDCDRNHDDLIERRLWRDESCPEHVLRYEEVDSEMSCGIAWNHYQGLLQQQRVILNSGADVVAFRYGIERFPSLRRVEVTSAAHGFLYAPLYRTPMIRAFPYGFNHSIPRGWPCFEHRETPCPMKPWRSDPGLDKWRGFRIIVEQLAQTQHQVTELLVDAHYLHSGLNCRIFEEPCVDYNNFTALLQTPKFRRLDLDLIVAGQERLGWPAFRSTLLRRALANAIDIEHLSMCADMNPYSRATFIHPNAIGEHHTPLRTIFPIDKWPHLKHFGLSGFLVRLEDLISFLGALPPSLRSVELSFLLFVDTPSSNYEVLLESIRYKLAWHKRDPATRPKLIIATNLNNPIAGRAIWLQDEIEDFLYHGGENPFGHDNRGPDRVAPGRGTVKDEFDPAFERLHVDSNQYFELGHCGRTGCSACSTTTTTS